MNRAQSPAEDPTRAGSITRSRSVLEVLVLFALMHVTFRAFRQLTPWGIAESQAGLNYSPGLLMIAIATTVILAGRRCRRGYGLTVEPLRENLSWGLYGLAVILFSGGIFVLLGVSPDPRRLQPGTGALVGLTGVLTTAGLLWLDSRVLRGRSLPVLVGAVIVLGLILLPIVLGTLRGASTGTLIAAVAWRFGCSGIGEEVFFRGLLQTRLNEAFGRPWRWFGVSFGPGLVGAALLFGLVHALNTVDYFGGNFLFAWGHAVATVGAPYGFLREKTGSVAAPALAHGLLNGIATIRLA